MKFQDIGNILWKLEEMLNEMKFWSDRVSRTARLTVQKPRQKDYTIRQNSVVNLLKVLNR